MKNNMLKKCAEKYADKYVKHAEYAIKYEKKNMQKKYEGKFNYVQIMYKCIICKTICEICHFKKT